MKTIITILALILSVSVVEASLTSETTSPKKHPNDIYHQANHRAMDWSRCLKEETAKLVIDVDSGLTRANMVEHVGNIMESCQHIAISSMKETHRRGTQDQIDGILDFWTGSIQTMGDAIMDDLYEHLNPETTEPNVN